MSQLHAAPGRSSLQGPASRDSATRELTPLDLCGGCLCRASSQVGDETDVCGSEIEIARYISVLYTEHTDHCHTLTLALTDVTTHKRAHGKTLHH